MAPASPEQKYNPVLGIVFMILTGLCFVAMTALVKIQGTHLPAIQTSFLRFAFGLVFVLPALRYLTDVNWTPRLFRLFALRGVFHACAVVCWFYSMTRIPLAEVTAMNHLNPVLITVLAALFLGEHLAIRRILAVLVALLGAVIVLRPGFRELDSGHFTMLITASALAGSYLFAKILTKEMGAGSVVAAMSVTVALILAPFAIAYWEPITLKDFGVMFCVAGLATLGHYLMTQSISMAPMSVVQPVVFLQLVWSITLGAMLFDEPVDPWVVAGGGLIIASVIYIAIREANLSRRKP